MISAPLPWHPIDIVLVCGGRRFSDAPYVALQLGAFQTKYQFRMLVHGEASGADLLSKQWAMENGIHPCGCPALWDYYKSRGQDTAAGVIRNRMMLILRPQLVIAFPGNTGTRHMIQCAHKAGVPFIDLENDYATRLTHAPKK